MFSYKDYITLSEGNSFPPCPETESTTTITPSPSTSTPPTILPTSTIISLTASPSTTVTPQVTPAMTYVTSPIPLYTPAPLCVNDTRPERMFALIFNNYLFSLFYFGFTVNKCEHDDVQKLYDVREYTENGARYKCTSISTLRFFNCNDCERTEPVCQADGSCHAEIFQYTCRPHIDKGSRQYKCHLLDTDRTDVSAEITVKIRGLTVQKGCDCCKTPVNIANVNAS